MTSAVTSIDALYAPRKGMVEFLDVPEQLYVCVEGVGDPNGPVFAAAVQALYAVSYGANFLSKKRGVEVHRVMPLEALWWLDDPRQQRLMVDLDTDTVDLTGVDRTHWKWRALIAQPHPLDEPTICDAVERARDKNLPALTDVQVQWWREGLAAQVLHVGPYAAEGPSILTLHRAIAAAGYRPSGRHHEIYLGDPRRSAPEKLRTILRQPVQK